jgi:TolA-binding protein
VAGAALVGAGALLGCGAPAPAESFLLAMAEGRRAYTAGRYAEAAESYRRAAALGTRVKDRDEGLFLEARMYQRLGRDADAAETYRRLVRVSADGPRTVRAIFELANIEIEHGDAARGWAALEAAVVRYPNHGSARKALAEVVHHKAEVEGEASARRFLAQVEPGFVATEAEQQAKYEAALSLERSGELAKARDAFLAMARAYPYPFGNLTDDAYWRAAQIDERLGRYAEAVAELQEMLTALEGGITGSSYDRPRFPYAQWRLAKIYRDRIKDPAAARREFHLMFERHPDASVADDALWQEALLARRAGEQDVVCQLMTLLRERYETSRYLRCVDRLCPGERPTEPARGCPRYIERTITGESVDVTDGEPADKEAGEHPEAEPAAEKAADEVDVAADAGPRG